MSTDAAATPAGPAGRVRVGTSGWRYASWRGDFYPRGLPQRRELEHIGRTMSTVELNGSFYSLQRPESYRRWRQSVPDGFVFAVKGSRYITHMLRLREPRTALANFLASGVLALGPALGPMLWQLPARQDFEPEVVGAFLAALPRTTGEALEIAREHDERLQGRAWLSVDEDRPLRHALEPRSPSFHDEAFAALLREHGAAMTVADTAGRWPQRRARACPARRGRAGPTGRRRPGGGAMKRLPVTSSALAAVGYDRATAVLEVEFRSGEVYRYYAVPASVHRELLAAPSLGRFFAERIRDRYPTEHLRA
ncbi:DUF72 domain-containing protein [Microbacterium sp. EF45047]|uniref:DUF72 domain-containing protein n=1 Tax=Microbacterium sp. EF45047 TaxID=2809708 RepID=UPI002348F3C6|nr:DUF72 domain-containing protein [Microbacterium sp. EF45047]